MSQHRIRRSIAAVVTAAAVGVVGIGAVAPETAQAAGVVLDHRAWGSGLATDRDD